MNLRSKGFDLLRGAGADGRSLDEPNEISPFGEAALLGLGRQQCGLL